MKRPVWRKARSGSGATGLSRDQFIAQSETGRRRNNEDACGYVVSPDGSAALMVLADGMGGHLSGEVASSMATESLLERFQRDQPVGDPERYLLSNTIEAHHRICSLASRDRQHEGMGSTLVALLLRPPKAIVAHVGDSRAYQSRGRCVRRLTQDHLYVVETLDVRENRAKAHPQGHVLAQALGIEGEIRPEISTVDVMSGDTLLLCSDGVSECLTEPAMGALLARLPMKEAVEAMIRLAIDNGSRDNCTVVAVRIA